MILSVYLSWIVNIHGGWSPWWHKGSIWKPLSDWAKAAVDRRETRRGLTAAKNSRDNFSLRTSVVQQPETFAKNSNILWINTILQDFTQYIESVNLVKKIMQNWYRLVKIGLYWSRLVEICPDWSHWSSLVKIGRDWLGLVQIDPYSSRLVQIGLDWSRLVQPSPEWSRLVQIGSDWYKQIQIGPDWSRFAGISPDWSRLIHIVPDWSKLV